MKLQTGIAVLTTGLLAACAQDPVRVESPATRLVMQPAPKADADRPLRYLAYIRTLDSRELNIEREAARGQFQREKTDFNRIKYALVLAVFPGNAPALSNLSPQDDVEIISVIEPLLNGAGTSGDREVRALAALVYSVINERRKLRELFRDTQSRAALIRKDEARDAEARVLRTRIEELEGKLYALKSIDRSVNRRADLVSK